MSGRELALTTANGGGGGALSIREAAARIVLREARQRGHDYVELRDAGRRIVFFCTLCLTNCFGDSSLWSHLNGTLHSKRLSSARRTLLGPLPPWPFSDGVLFFSTSPAAIHDRNGNSGVIINNVLVGEKLSQLPIHTAGIGHVSASFPDTTEKLGKTMCRIWCAWLGDGALPAVSECDVAIVNLSYNCNLGRKSTTEELSMYLEDGGSPRKRLKKSFSDPEEEEDTGEYGGQCDSEESSCSVGRFTKEEGFDRLRLTSSKTIRREMRRRERLAAERICDICQQRMLPGKDVAALLNLKTGRLACSSRNSTGAFHVFHVSCLIHWILLCEFEIWRNNKPVKTRGGRGRKGKRAAKGHISAVFCPECQGTGADVKEEQLENPTIHLSEMFLYKLKAIQGHRAWMEDPEPLTNCSTGLILTCEEQHQGKVLPSKLLHFYRADI